MKLKQIYLHIGLEKTGTTSIQYALSRSRPMLREANILYPLTPGNVNHIDLCGYAMEDEPENPIHARLIKQYETLQKFRRVFRNKFIKEIEESEIDTLILSNEHLSSTLKTPNDLNRLKNLLDPCLLYTSDAADE